MKKVLFGLVIALTMCGSGYASEYSKNCFFLKRIAHSHIKAFRESDISTIKNEKKQSDYHLDYAQKYAELLKELCMK